MAAPGQLAAWRRSLFSLALGSVQACFGELVLSGLDPSALPEQSPLPVWARDDPTAGYRKDDIISLNNPAVAVWREANTETMHPSPLSSGWRVRATGLPKQEWCVRRLTFSDANGDELKGGSSGCQIVASAAGSLMPQFAPDNAFRDDAGEGCALQDEAGQYFIGIICDDVHEVQKVEVMQLSPKSSALSAKIQQYSHGRWLDVGRVVEMPVAAAKVIFVAATCPPDACIGKWTPRTGEDYPKTCARRVCNTGECCKHKDTCKAAACVTPFWGLKANAKGVRCAGTACDESFCCEKKDFCRPLVCPADMRLKPNVPRLCKTGACAADECCERPTCTEELCGQSTLLDQNVTCKAKFCTAVECCVPMHLRSQRQAQCEQSVCSYNGGWIFRDDAFGKWCTTSTCTEAECCQSPPPPVPELLFGAKPALLEFDPTPLPLSPGRLVSQVAVGLVPGLAAASLAVVAAAAARAVLVDRRTLDPEAEGLTQAHAPLDA